MDVNTAEGKLATRNISINIDVTAVSDDNEMSRDQSPAES